jgi:hypothetical protein
VKELEHLLEYSMCQIIFFKLINYSFGKHFVKEREREREEEKEFVCVCVCVFCMKIRHFAIEKKTKQHGQGNVLENFAKKVITILGRKLSKSSRF